MTHRAPHRTINAPAALYRGKVMHARMKPRAHRFTYRVLSLLIDLGRLNEAARLTPLLRINRAGVFSFQERDHGGGGPDLRAWLDDTLRKRGIAGIERVLLLCYPRMLGYVFNPLSVYYCYGVDGALAAIVYEVRNTFGDIHHYVRPVKSGEISAAGIRQEEKKAMYVSPFIDMDMRYHFRMSPPDDDVKIRILETDSEGPLLSAIFTGQREPVTSARLLATLAGLPFMTVKIIAAIHYEALRLWLKGIRLVPRGTENRPAGKLSRKIAGAAGQD